VKRFFQNNPFAIIMIAVLAYQSVMEGRIFSDPLGWLIDQLLFLPGIIIAITFHEFAHAFAAYKLGDMTPKFQRRVNLNPLSHIDPVGFIALFTIGFGWGRPVMVNPYAFRKRRLYNFIVDIAGITTNFILAILFMGLLKLYIVFLFPHMAMTEGSWQIISTLFTNTIWINLVLMIFNLLPVPPLDGFGIITEIFDLREKAIYQKIYNLGFPILMVLIFFNVTGKIISPIISALYGFLTLVFFGV
jgi:Zn-dependent protease